jgi:hypothetical protein
MNIRQVEPELFQADGETDMTKLIVAFRHFSKATKKCMLVRDTRHCNKQDSPQEFLRISKRKALR